MSEMSMELVAAVGAALGAFVRRAIPGETQTRQTASDCVVAALGVLALFGIMGTVMPEDLVQSALKTVPRAVGVGAMAGYSGVDLLRLLAERFTPKINTLL